MALSPGWIVALGALGVGGYALYRKLKEQQANADPCGSLLKTAAQLVGYDLLPGMEDSAAAKLLCGAASSLTNVGDTLNKTGTFFSKIVGGGGTGICTKCCPPGTSVDTFDADKDGYLLRDLRSGSTTLGIADGERVSFGCRDQSTGQITYILRDNAEVVPYTPGAIEPPPVVGTPTGSTSEHVEGPGIYARDLPCAPGGGAPAGYTWDASRQMWRKLAPGESPNPGPCASSTPSDAYVAALAQEPTATFVTTTTANTATLIDASSTLAISLAGFGGMTR